MVVEVFLVLVVVVLVTMELDIDDMVHGGVGWGTLYGGPTKAEILNGTYWRVGGIFFFGGLVLHCYTWYTVL